MTFYVLRFAGLEEIDNIVEPNEVVEVFQCIFHFDLNELMGHLRLNDFLVNIENSDEILHTGLILKIQLTKLINLKYLVHF